jgi:L-lactate dehydrogenase complex protein LldE
VSAQRVALLPTCVVDTVSPEVGEAVVRVLRRLECDVVVPEAATCCGQPAWNAGFSHDAAQVAARTLNALIDELDQHPGTIICVPAGSCAAMIRVFWPELFHLASDHDAVERARRVGSHTREFSELVHERSGGTMTGVYPAEVAYHHSCHMLRELRIKDAPEEVLGGLDRCHLNSWSAAERCCGFGGLFSVKLPETSVAMADDKLSSLAENDITHLVGSDQSCLLHLRGRLRKQTSETRDNGLPGPPITVKHLAQVLDEAGARPRAGTAEE